MKKLPLFFLLIVLFAFVQSLEACRAPTTYRIPRRTLDHIIDDSVQLQYRTALHFLKKSDPHPELDRFMMSVDDPLRKQVWGAIDILLAEPGESLACMVAGEDCIRAGLFLFDAGCPVVRVMYEESPKWRDPLTWYEAAIARRAWRNDTGFIFVYDDEIYGNYFFRSNLDLPVYAPEEKSAAANENHRIEALLYDNLNGTESFLRSQE